MIEIIKKCTFRKTNCKLDSLKKNSYFGLKVLTATANGLAI